MNINLFQEYKKIPESYYLDNILFITAIMLPITLIVGAFFSNLFASIVSLTFLIITVKKRDNFYYLNIYFLVFLLFCFILIISSLASDYKLFSLKTSLLYFRHGLLTLGICYCIINFKNFKIYFFYSLIFTFILLAITGYYEFINNYNIFGDKSVMYRLSMFTTGKLIIGGYIARMLPLCIAIFLLVYKDFSNYNISLVFYFLLFMLIFVLIFLSGERTAMGIGIVSMIIIFFLLEGFKKIKLITIILITTLLGITLSYNENIKVRIIDHTYSQLGYENKRLNLISSVHEEYYLESINMFKSSPFIGKGANTFRKYCDDSDYNIGTYCSTHPHNFYFQLLGETGLFGFILLFIFFIIISWIILKQSIFKYIRVGKGISNYLIILYSSIFSLLLPIFPSLNFFNSWNSINLFLLLGFILAEHYEIKKT